jgi:hypothetical protein
MGSRELNRSHIRKLSICGTIFQLLPTILLVALTLSGCASLSGNLTASPASLSFGNVAIGSTSHQSLSLTNSGTDAFTLTQAVASGGGFTVKGPRLPLTLAGGQSATFTTSFAPSAIGSISGSLSITKSQLTTPRVSTASVPMAPIVTAQTETIPMTGAGVPVTLSITSQPTSQTVAVGQTVTFSVTASGAAPLSYQWRKNGTAISAATWATYEIPTVATSDSGSQLTVVVRNSAGSVTSNSATLTVNAAGVGPSIAIQPVNHTVTAGQTATFSVTGSGTASLKYQWFDNGTVIIGATSSAYTTPVTTLADNGSQFSVAVSDTFGTVSSSLATLTVKAAGQLTASTASLSYGTVMLGSSKILPVTLTNMGVSSISISNVTLSGTGVSVSGVSSGLILAAGSSAALNVTFAPFASGNMKGTVNITSSATNATVTISLLGTAVQPGSHFVTLGLSGNSSSVRGFNVYRSSVSGGPYTKLNSSQDTVATYTDSSILGNHTYFYIGTSVDSVGKESANSNEVSVTIPAP